MNELIFIVEEAPEGGFVARTLGQSLFSEADTLAELPEKVRDAVRCHFEEERGQRLLTFTVSAKKSLPYEAFPPSVWRRSAHTLPQLGYSITI